MKFEQPLEKGRFKDYLAKLNHATSLIPLSQVDKLLSAIKACWEQNRQVFLCGNGGSAGNAIHIANDFLYGVAKKIGGGIKIHALPANSSIVTCLANDVGYQRIFSEQIAVYGQPGDILIVLSGSGNSPNVVEAIEQARRSNVKSFAILGYSGGRTLELADEAIHIPIDDMQIAEDLQLIIMHMVMQSLSTYEGQ
jgi:D-sedoheptulose 7-phosphate isomerase